MKGKRFEIWLADLNPRFGTESGKKRPVLIIQTDLLNSSHPSTIICPLTSQVNQEVNILRVYVSKDSGGLEKDSAIMIDQVRAIDNQRLMEKLGDLPEILIPRVTENLRIILDL